MTIKDAGGVALAMSAVGNPYMFTGRRMDDESGLYYFRARYFDAELGRFISRDPLGYMDGMGLYNGYFAPNGMDPTGLWNQAGHFYTVYMVARAAGFSRMQAYKYATYAQYPDQNHLYDAMGAHKNRGDVQRYLHVLNGGDAREWRKHLACLLKDKNMTDEEKGILLHAYGDTFAHSQKVYHTYRNGKRQIAPKKRGGRRDTWERRYVGERLYPPVVGHAHHGHLPDYIATHRDAYKRYVKSMYEVMRQMNPSGTGNPNLVSDLVNMADNVKNLKRWRFLGIDPQNRLEIDAILDAGSKNNLPYDFPYKPEGEPFDKGNFPAEFQSDELRDWRKWDTGSMEGLINKIKNGIKDCKCPSK